VTHVLDLLTHWDFAPVPTLAILIALGGYLVAVRVVDRRHPTQPWPIRHTVAFCGGLLSIVWVTIGPIGVYDDTFFWAHMTQHIVLMMLAAPLLLLGEPVLLILRVSSRSFRRRVVIPILHSRVVRALTNPVVTWVLFASVLVGTHFTGFYEYALEHNVVHVYVEHPLYLTAGLLYYYPLLGSSPGGAALPPFAKVVSQFLMMLPETMTGFALYMTSAVIYPYYEQVSRPWGPSSALADQRLGGSLMWASGMVLDALWISVAAWQWFKAEETKARRIDAALAAGRLAPGH
jgi:cytochrome c oxidase assembly factor CtaG